MIEDAKRCLLCKNAQCKQNCPISTDIPLCMELYRQGNLEQAGKILFENNPMSVITSLLCDWDRFCRGHCVLNAKNDPIHWHDVEHDISLQYIKNLHLTKNNSKDKTIGIIGAGPAGITAAILLSIDGYNVTLYDRHNNIGGILNHGIPSFRFDHSLIKEYERLLSELDVSLQLNTTIGDSITINQLSDKYDALIVTVGATKSRHLNIPGENLDHVLYAIDYLENPSAYTLGDKVIVIGGGNVAMDAVRTAHRFGKQASVYYRKTFENMPASKYEVQQALDEGIPFHVFKAPVEVKEHSVVFNDCVNEVDDNGKTITKILDNTNQEVECDTLLVAAGEGIDLSLFGDSLPTLNKWNYPETDEYGKTSLPNVWIAGDFLLGASTVIQATASAKKAIEGIEREIN